MANNHEHRGPLLTVRDVSLTLGGNRILRDVDADIVDWVGHGQVVGLLGPSGIGKTQFLRILAGLQSPDKGTVLLGEKQEPTSRGKVGVVTQDYRVFVDRTVLSNLVVAGRQAGLSRAESRDKALDLLGRFGLGDRARFWPGQLSGGQRQRLAILQQAMCSEHFIIMDEPFSGLDPIATEAVCKLVKEYADAHELNTIIVISHDITATVNVSDTLWLMGCERDPEGKIVKGARIRKVYDLVEAGLAWREGISTTSEFAEFVRSIRAEFPNLTAS